MKYAAKRLREMLVLLFVAGWFSSIADNYVTATYLFLEDLVPLSAVVELAPEV